jgi:hypothetical protein
LKGTFYTCPFLLVLGGVHFLSFKEYAFWLLMDIFPVASRVFRYWSICWSVQISLRTIFGLFCQWQSPQRGSGSAPYEDWVKHVPPPSDQSFSMSANKYSMWLGSINRK